MKNRISLVIPKTLVNLAGYDYGYDIYLTQIKGVIDTNKEFVIEFPEHVEVVASSFVQGLFSEIVEDIGLYATEQRAKILSRSEKLSDGIIKKLQ